MRTRPRDECKEAGVDTYTVVFYGSDEQEWRADDLSWYRAQHYVRWWVQLGFGERAAVLNADGLIVDEHFRASKCVDCISSDGGVG